MQCACVCKFLCKWHRFRVILTLCVCVRVFCVVFITLTHTLWLVISLFNWKRKWEIFCYFVKGSLSCWWMWETNAKWQQLYVIEMTNITLNSNAVNSNSSSIAIGISQQLSFKINIDWSISVSFVMSIFVCELSFICCHAVRCVCVCVRLSCSI